MSRKQLLEDLSVGYRVQREWRWLILLAFFLGGVGGGMFAIASLQDYAAGMLAGLLVVIVGKGTAHVLFLGHPFRFWRMLAAPRTSWISRGLYAFIAFAVFGILHLAPYYGAFSWLPWDSSTVLGQVIWALSLLSTLVLVTYTGFVMAYSPSIQLWATPLLPAVFGLYAVSGGIGGIFLLRALSGEGTDPGGTLEKVELALIATAAVLITMYLLTMRHSTPGAQTAVRELVSGRLAISFWAGVIGLGLVIPFVLVLMANGDVLSEGSIGPVIAVAGVLELAGSLLLRRCLLWAGVYAPVF